jgi:NAD(P)-dependent dehydrogenase (short-subunit alcohol dehydrogenase family)
VSREVNTVAHQAPHESRALRDSRAVVTGAAGGIGAAISRQLIREGATVHGLDRDGDALERMAQECGLGSFVAYRVDLADRAALERVLGDLSQRLEGRCDILVNNAGVSRLRSLADTDDGLLDWMFAVNFFAAFRVTRALLPTLRVSGRGAIVNIASELALVGQPDYSAYCATKGAMLAWSRALALELAGDSIRVNVVCPGPVDTLLLQEEFATHADPRAARAAEIGTIPLSRLGIPADIAPVVAFLASDAAAFVTGAAWCVDGGKTAR